MGNYFNKAGFEQVQKKPNKLKSYAIILGSFVKHGEVNFDNNSNNSN